MQPEWYNAIVLFNTLATQSKGTTRPWSHQNRYLLYAVVDQPPRLGKRELVFLLHVLFTFSFVVSVSGRFLFLLVLGMGCAFLLWYSLGLPLIIL